MELWNGPTSVADTGMSVVYEPSGVPTVEAIRSEPGLRLDQNQGSMRKRILKTFRAKAVTSSGDAGTKLDEAEALGSLIYTTNPRSLDGVSENGSLYYWPREALPEFCPGARILVWGYDSHVTKGFKGPVNKSSVYQHGKDLLYGLNRLGSAPRPMIVVAHSLGGIITKEMLALSQNSSEERIKAILEATAAIVFLGTPHRGSPMAKLGDSVSRIVSSLGLDTSSTLLDSLGLKTSDLQRSQESFSAIWNNNPLRVKTFQEGRGLTGFNVGPLNDKVVDDISSSIGDEREHAEVLNANHRDMCRFSGPRDPELIKVLAELADICNFTLDLKPIGHSLSDRSKGQIRAMEITQANTAADIHDQESKLLESLVFPGMHEASRPWSTTGECEWLFKQPEFTKWSTENVEPVTHPILWIKGNPGSGKSTAMKDAVQRLSTDKKLSHVHFASFFFDLHGDELLRSPSGLFRSLLFQLLPRNRQAMTRAVNRYKLRIADSCAVADIWSQAQLSFMFQDIFIDAGSPTIVLVDALDECGSPDNTRWLAEIFHDLVFMEGVKLRICLSTRHHGAISLTGCEHIVAEMANGPDIKHYIDKSLSRYQRQDKDEFTDLKEMIEGLSCGIFLWVVLVTQYLINHIVKGRRSCLFLKQELSALPEALAELYNNLIKEAENTRMTLRVLRWAILAKKLTLRDWRYLLPFLNRPTPSSFTRCQSSRFWADDDEDLADMICNSSMGLVRVFQNPLSPSLNAGSLLNGDESQHEKTSLGGRAGSLDSAQGETRLVYVIHRSVVDFFHHDLRHLRPKGGIGGDHVDIIRVCFRLIAAPDLDELVTARLQKGSADSLRSCSIDSFNESRLGGSNSVRSFSSASTQSNKRHTGNAFKNMYLKTRRDQDKPQNSLFLFVSTAERELPKFEQRQFRLQLLLGREDDGNLNSTECMSHVEEPTPDIGSAGHGKSKVLHAWPEVLDYAISELSFHVKEAHEHKVDPENIILPLSAGNAKLWKRWLCLCEDKPHDTSLRDWAATEGLDSWIECLRDNERPFSNAQFHYADTNNALFVKPCTQNEIDFYNDLACRFPYLAEWFPPCYKTVKVLDSFASITMAIKDRMADKDPEGFPRVRQSTRSLFSLCSTMEFQQATNIPNSITNNPDPIPRPQALVLGNEIFGFKRPNVLTVQIPEHKSLSSTGFRFRTGAVFRFSGKEDFHFQITGIKVPKPATELFNTIHTIDETVRPMSKIDIMGRLWQFVTNISIADEQHSLAKEISTAFSRELMRLYRTLRITKAISGLTNVLLAYDGCHDELDQVSGNALDESPLKRYRVKLFGFSNAYWNNPSCPPDPSWLSDQSCPIDPFDPHNPLEELYYDDLSLGIRELADLFRELSEESLSSPTMWATREQLALC